ncbi:MULTISPECIES: helix-turn-helix domain-containing GNAT family N-acetyltransferase [unclassified Sphingomonas]|jgi:DNA-binding MarR family transcriptional regulator/predicted GNAT family acetyltransferase|uniref:bifunctional helix-turn-helix transcriptional regulator/GNAT family N-acetyltransferase n=1 Tax=unclassified Sphingomonas TaxID=196159 RepID=UPI000A6D3ADE|nr:MULTISPECIES: helix-turn-helix domain-containing GNAT family N-acetyltransferase [unclassified Sphingomonas]
MEQPIEQFRAFNRAHTRFAAVLSPRYMDSDMGVAEARLLYEIAGRQPVLATALQEVLGLDAGYVSRAIKRFEDRGWIARERGEQDGRQRPIVLLPAGRAAFDALDDATRAHSGRQLESLGPGGGALLGHHLAAARALIEGGTGSWTIRTLRTGDMGAIASRQAIFYAEHYGWERPMELLLGDVTTGFLRDFQPGREQCWVAERGGEMLGSVMLADGGNGVAKLRLLYVEGHARGLGIGDALVRRCVAFAREAGYARLDLWTHTILASARRIYAAQGFELVDSAAHTLFGEPVMGETWSLDLSRDASPATP